MSGSTEVAAARRGLGNLSKSDWFKRVVAVSLGIVMATGPGHTQTLRTKAELSTAQAALPAWHQTAEARNEAEVRLLDVYRLLSAGRGREALSRVEALVNDHPNFQLAQLVYGDLLMARTHALSAKGGGAPLKDVAARQRLEQLRLEASRRLDAFRYRPRAGYVPAPFVELPLSSRHAIAVDISKSRLYLFENTAQGLKLLSDHYVSIGLLGAAAFFEKRTPHYRGE